MNFLLFALASLAVAVACPPCCGHPRCRDELPCPCLISDKCPHSKCSAAKEKPAPPPLKPSRDKSICGKRCNEKPCDARKLHKHDNYGGKDWYLPYVSPLQRYYNRKYGTHHFHTEPGPISSFLADGYHKEGPTGTSSFHTGRMITVRSYNQQKREIRRHCPFLVPLYTAINRKTRSQKLTTYVSELNVLTESGQGWYKLEQVGYCVRGEKCGATKPLWEIRVKNKLSDVLYTSDMSEISVVKKQSRSRCKTPPAFIVQNMDEKKTIICSVHLDCVSDRQCRNCGEGILEMQYNEEQDMRCDPRIVDHNENVVA